FEFCQSRRPVTLRYVWRDAGLQYAAASTLRLDLSCRWISNCLWLVHAPRCIHLKRRDGGGLFHGSRAAELLSKCQQGRPRRLLFLVLLLRWVLWPWPVEG